MEVDSIYSSTTESRKFLEEALTMRDFDHIHILKLIGIVIDKEEMPLVVLPFMRHGDLLSYIRNERNVSCIFNFSIYSWNSTITKRVVLPGETLPVKPTGLLLILLKTCYQTYIGNSHTIAPTH